ncbi:hypothetical protein [Pinibacter aurantiacus]|uniref:Uncharacterized protein n=1 Tax=Pinibacter aurantiacus TaxID=2851599 RepID=A0A9E2SB87_9BACT|nr:hypothetical protein [Pinibacter aurantiacus]MBV4358273.1 hypothetical protein [Pinibacter aurantiacus]
MKKSAISLLVVVLVFSACTRIKLVTVDSTNVANKNNTFIFSNDTVSVKYDFWASGGGMNFEIINNTNKPLYFDWKKSAFLPNNKMMSYWKDETNTVSTGTSSYYYGFSTASGKSKSIRKERIGVVPPKASITSHIYTIVPKTQTAPKVGNYSYDNSPLKFRNYLVMSFTESFSDQEFYLDNEFFIKEVKSITDTKKDKFKSSTAFWAPK